MGKTIPLSEALELMIKAGMSPRNAKRKLLKHLANGDIPATGFLTRNFGGQMVTTGRREEIDSRFWRNEP